MKLIIEDRHYLIVKEILSRYTYSFYAFGSRIKGNARKLSDLDLCVMESVPGNILVHIEEEFENSDLPFKVDIIEMNNISKAFRDSIKADLVAI